MVTSWGAHSEIVESSLREPRNYFELIYHTAKMLWEKWQNHLFAACCWNAGLVWITHAKRALCCEPALLREICFSLLYSSLVGLPCRGPSSEIAFCVITFVGIHKIWIQMGLPWALLSSNSPVPSGERGAELFAGWTAHSMAILPFPCLAEGEGVVYLWEVIISLGTVGCGLDKARRMSLNVLLWWLGYRQQQNKTFTCCCCCLI